MSRKLRKPTAKVVPLAVHRKKHKSKPRSTDPYTIRDQELKMEESKRALRRTLNWKSKQQKDLEREVKATGMRRWLKGKLEKKHKKNTHKPTLKNRLLISQKMISSERCTFGE